MRKEALATRRREWRPGGTVLGDREIRHPMSEDGGG